jgi:hypothetical protein
MIHLAVRALFEPVIYSVEGYKVTSDMWAIPFSMLEKSSLVRCRQVGFFLYGDGQSVLENHMRGYGLKDWNTEISLNRGSGGNGGGLHENWLYWRFMDYLESETARMLEARG